MPDTRLMLTSRRSVLAAGLVGLLATSVRVRGEGRRLSYRRWTVFPYKSSSTQRPPDRFYPIVICRV